MPYLSQYKREQALSIQYHLYSFTLPTGAATGKSGGLGLVWGAAEEMNVQCWASRLKAMLSVLIERDNLILKYEDFTVWELIVPVPHWLVSGKLSLVQQLNQPGIPHV